MILRCELEIQDCWRVQDSDKASFPDISPDVLPPDATPPDISFFVQILEFLLLLAAFRARTMIFFIYRSHDQFLFLLDSNILLGFFAAPIVCGIDVVPKR